MDKFKLQLLNFKNNFFSFLLKKDENSKIKYKNLLSTLTGVVVIIIVCIVVVSSCHTSKMQRHPDDNTSGEISFEDNRALAVDPVDSYDLERQEALLHSDDANELKLPDNTAAEDSSNYADNNTESVTASKKDTGTNKTGTDEITQEKQEVSSSDSSSYDLYCNSYRTIDDASEKKARIAFEAGLRSDVVRNNGTYRLHLGPYKTRQEAIDSFNLLDGANLITGECSLEKKE
ncbi:MAG: SPOR domain-containing protein [Succinivibrio sp.]